MWVSPAPLSVTAPTSPPPIDAHAGPDATIAPTRPAGQRSSSRIGTGTVTSAHSPNGDENAIRPAAATVGVACRVARSGNQSTSGSTR